MALKKNYENMCLNINMHTYINTVDKIFLKHFLLYRVRQIFFFGKCFKKTTEYILPFLFLFESTIHPVNNGT